MSREEAASVYLDVLLGFRAEFAQYLIASEMLTEQDKGRLQNAVYGCPGGRGSHVTEAARERFFTGPN
jgi:hypothetical protein